MCDYILRTEFAPLFTTHSPDVGGEDVRSEEQFPTPGVTPRLDKGSILTRVISQCFGYKFRQSPLLVTAFTHPVRTVILHSHVYMFNVIITCSPQVDWTTTNDLSSSETHASVSLQPGT